MPAAVNVISMTLIQQAGKEKLLILKTKTHCFHAANISYRYISSKPQFFIIRQTRAFSYLVENYLSGDLNINLGAFDDFYTTSAINILFQIKNF